MNIQKMITDYQNGVTLRTMAAEYNCTVDRIRNQLKKSNVYVLKKVAKCELDEEKICNLYKNDMSIKDISLELGVSVGPVKRILTEHKIMKPVWVKEVSYKISLALRDGDELKRLYAIPMSKKQICEHIGCTIDIIDSAFRRHGLIVRNSGMTRSLKKRAKCEFKFNKSTCDDLYTNKRMSLEEVSEKVGVSVGYLRTHFKKWGIETHDTKLSTELLSVINNREELQKLYDNSSTVRELATKLNCGMETMSKTLRDNNVTIKTHADRRNDNYADHLLETLTDYTIININKIDIDLIHDKCNTEFNVQKQIISKYAAINKVDKICPSCFNRHKSSLEEEEVLDYIKSIYSGKIVRFNRSLLGTKEIDILIPNLKLAIEYCGIYYHSEEMGKDSSYHKYKTFKLREQGYKLITLFSDEWYNKQDIVKARIKHALGLNNQKVFARKCNIKEITPTIKNEFLEKYHIQGGDRSMIKLGLYFEKELISVMTFSKPNIAKGGKNKEGVWELNRFASKEGIVVIGGAGKLLSYFKKNFSWTNIFSFADLRWSDGKLYETLGFELEKITMPNYWYMKRSCRLRIHRFNFRKDKLIKMGYSAEKTEAQIMRELDYLKIWDCGSLKFVMKKEDNNNPP